MAGQVRVQWMEKPLRLSSQTAEFTAQTLAPWITLRVVRGRPSDRYVSNLCSRALPANVA
jgi:hypothetical protein